MMPTDNQTTDSLAFDASAEIVRALSNPHRLALLDVIFREACSVEQLAAQTNLTLANASQHLKQLKLAGLVQSHREGKHVLYRPGNGPVKAILDAVTRYVEFRHREMSRFVSVALNQRERLESISRQELLERLREGNVTLLDVRPATEYGAGHLPGAINIPENELEARLSELSLQQDIVAYCRGPYCMLSTEAGKLLKAQGYRVHRLEEGFPEWQAAGLQVESDT